MVAGSLSIGVIDVLDILLVAFIIYWVLLFIRGTRAVQMLFGLLILMVMYVVAKKAGMVTFQWLVGNFLENLLVVLVVVFHSEIRRGLARIGQWRLFGGGGRPRPGRDRPIRPKRLPAWRKSGSARSCSWSARWGSRNSSSTAKSSTRSSPTNWPPRSFATSPPVHDGVVIRHNRIAAAGSSSPSRPNRSRRGMGTRHRAAWRGVRNGRGGGGRLRRDGEHHGLSNRSANRAETVQELRDTLGLLLRKGGGAP